MSDDIKIFQNDTVEECLKRCLDEGYFPLNARRVRNLLEEGILERGTWYDTSTVLIDGEHRDATLKELKDIKNFYRSGGKIFYVDDRKDDDDDSYDALNGDGCFVGISKEKYSLKQIEDTFKNLKLEGLTEQYVRELRK